MEEIEDEGEEAASKEGGAERAEDRIGTPQENCKTPRYYIRCMALDYFINPGIIFIPLDCIISGLLLH